MTANVITYRDRSAAREVGKALGYSPEQVDSLSKQLAGWSFGEIRRADRATAGTEIAGGGLRPRGRPVAALPAALPADPEPAAAPRPALGRNGRRGRAAGRGRAARARRDARARRRAVGQGRLRGPRHRQGRPAGTRDARRDRGGDPDDPHERKGRRGPRAPAAGRSRRSTACCNEADTVGLFQVESRAQMASLAAQRPAEVLRHRRAGRDHPAGPDRRAGWCDPFFDRRRARAPSSIRIRASSRSSRARSACRSSRSSSCASRWSRRASRAARRRSCGGRWASSAPSRGWRAIEARLRAGMTERGSAPRRRTQIVKSITSLRAVRISPSRTRRRFALIAYASAYLQGAPPGGLLRVAPERLADGLLPSGHARQGRAAPRHRGAVRSTWPGRDGACRWEKGGVRLGLCFVQGLRAATGERLEQEQGAAPLCRRRRPRPARRAAGPAS